MNCRVTFMGLSFSGKTFWAMHLTKILNEQGIIAEFLMEPFKDWCYLDMPVPDCYAELSAFFETARREEKRLSKGVECIVSDSGLWTILYYISQMNQGISIRTCLDTIFRIEAKYPSINILLPPRTLDESAVVGRWSAHTTSDHQRTIQYENFKDVLQKYRCQYIEAVNTDQVVNDVIVRLLSRKGLTYDQPARRGKRRRT